MARKGFESPFGAMDDFIQKLKHKMTMEKFKIKISSIEEHNEAMENLASCSYRWFSGQDCRSFIPTAFEQNPEQGYWLCIEDDRISWSNKSEDDFQESRMVVKTTKDERNFVAKTFVLFEPVE